MSNSRGRDAMSRGVALQGERAMRTSFRWRVATICSVVALAQLFGIQPAAAAWVEECTDHMQAPWVALYEHADFQGDSICVMGTGLYNLNGIGWGNRVSSVNIGAEGRFGDGSINPCPQRCLFYNYGTRIADLRTMGWNDRIQIVHSHR